MSKTLTGIVVSDKTDKTIVVSVSRLKTHPIYKKQYGVTKKFMAHDPNNLAKVGDTVVISETKPISARKRFILDKVVEKSKLQAKDKVEAVVAEPVEEPKAKKVES